MKKFERLVNIGIALLTVVVAILLAYRFAGLEKRLSPGDSKIIEGGLKLPIEGVDWVKNRRTVVLALTEDCSYCAESMPFYKLLSQQLLSAGNGKFVVVFPTGSKASEDYLQRSGISASEVRYEPFNLLGVTGTPTLMLVSESGVVVDKWIGRLGPGEERKVLDRLQLNDGLVTEVASRPPEKAAVTANFIAPSSLKQEIDQAGKLIVLDIRLREKFAGGHIPSSRNIPADELEVRSINELPRHAHIVVYCDAPNEDDSIFANAILQEQKFGRVSVLNGGLPAWRKAGLPVVTR